MATSYKDDCLHRPVELESECLYSFIESYSIQSKNGLLLKPDHPKYSSKYVCKRKIKIVPEIIGPRIPDRTKTEDQIDYYTYALVLLFKP